MYIFLAMLLAGFPLYLLLKPPPHPVELFQPADAYAGDFAYVSEASSNV